jgi:hypothetical protein
MNSFAIVPSLAATGLKQALRANLASDLFIPADDPQCVAIE